jgi:integral membrane sensor domain MASE1
MHVHHPECHARESMHAVERMFDHFLLKVVTRHNNRFSKLSQIVIFFCVGVVVKCLAMAYFSSLPGVDIHSE